VHQHYRLRHHRMTRCRGQRRHGAPALTYPICLGLKDRIGACSLCLYPARCDGDGGHESSCSEALRGRPNRVVAMCDEAPLQSIACACTLRGIAGSQDLHDGGFSCHVPPVSGPTAKPASPLSVVALRNYQTCHSGLSLRHRGFTSCLWSAEHPTSLPCAHPA
jgi:hypothetical protein